MIHDLDKIYEECMKLDNFFKDESLSRNFLPIKLLLPDTAENWSHLTWAEYIHALRYPESLPKGRRSKGAIISTGYGGTYRTLDCIAHFVRQDVPRPEEERDVIDNFVNGNGDIWAANAPDELPEIRELFLRGNQFFSP